MLEYAILLVTANQDVAEPVHKAAHALGEKLHRVSTAADAIDYLTENPVSLILVDQILPDQLGLNLLQEVIGITPFVQRGLIMDADADADVAVVALNRAKVSLLLDKPLDTEQTMGHLKETLEGYNPEHQEQLSVHFENGRATPESNALKMERLCTIGEIASSLVHQFNNTLTIMMGHLELLALDMEEKGLEGRLDTLLQAAEDGVQLTQNLQDFVRSESNKNTEFDLNKLVQDTISMTKPIWNSGKMHGKLQIETQFAEDLPAMQGNPSEIREALTNLVLNALDAMQKGGRLTIRTGCENNTIHLEIMDTGIGIPEDIQQRIFEPFFTTKGERGNGLGLGVVQRTIEEHGGHIHVESRPGKGTKFLLLLPLKQAPLAPAVIPLFESRSEQEVALP